MTKGTTSLRQSPARRREPPLAFFPDPAGRRELARYLRGGGAATPTGAPVVRPLARTTTTVAFTCPYCDAAHAVPRDASPHAVAPCGSDRVLFVQAGTHTVGMVGGLWDATLGRGHQIIRRARHLAQLASRLERLEGVAAPWTRRAPPSTRFRDGTVDQPTHTRHRAHLVLVQGGQP